MALIKEIFDSIKIIAPDKKNKEYYKEYGKKYRAKNREKLNAYRNKWYYEHREEELERQRAYDQRKRDANGN